MPVAHLAWPLLLRAAQLLQAPHPSEKGKSCATAMPQMARVSARLRTDLLWGRDHPCVLPTQRSALNINNNKGRGFSAAMVWKKTQINFPTPFLSVSASESKKHNLLQSYQIRAVARALSGQLRSAEESGAGGALFRPRLPAGLALSRGGSCSSPGPTMPRVPGHPPGVPGTHRETRQENGGVRLGSGLGSCVLKAIIF